MALFFSKKKLISKIESAHTGYWVVPWGLNRSLSCIIFEIQGFGSFPQARMAVACVESI